MKEQIKESIGLLLAKMEKALRNEQYDGVEACSKAIQRLSFALVEENN